MKRIYSLLTAGVLLAAAGPALAGQPVQLTDGQMDKVTAGFLALANAGGVAVGDFEGVTTSQVETEVNVLTHPFFSVGLAANTSTALSTLFSAFASSHSDATAQ